MVQDDKVIRRKESKLNSLLREDYVERCNHKCDLRYSYLVEETSWEF